MAKKFFKRVKTIYSQFIKHRSISFLRFGNLIWPTYEKEEDLNPPSVFKAYYDALKQLKTIKERGLILKLYENSKCIYDEEEKRRMSIEQKATISLSATGISAAIIVGLASVLIENKLRLNSAANIIILCWYSVSLLYLLRATIGALRIFGKVTRYVVGPDDLLLNTEAETSYLLHLSEKFIWYTIENYKINNRQLAIVWVSQECFRNAIFSLVMCGLFIGIRMFWG